MVNFGLNSASILGIFLAVAGAGLYFLRSIRPELSRDHDIFFAAVGLLCGFILLFQGWRLDPILQFGQFLLTGSAIFFAVETIRLRGVATEQARRNTPIVDDDRPVSKVYRAELDQLEPYDEEVDDRYDNRRLRGYQDPRASRRSGYDAEDPRGAKPRTRGDRAVTNEPPKRRPRPNPDVRPTSDRYQQWDEGGDVWEDRNNPPTRNRRPRPESQPPEDYAKSSRPRRSRPSIEDIGVSYEEDATPADYVDYQPLDDSDSRDRGYDGQDDDRDDQIPRNRNNSPTFDY